MNKTAHQGYVNPAPAFLHDPNSVDWRDFITEGCYYKLLNVDVAGRHADMLVKFDANCDCLYHRHAATTTTLVLQGELRVREQTENGEVIKLKPAGSYSIGGEGEVHIEGSGDETAIIFFSMHSDTDVIYELLNDDLTLRKAITVADFHRDWLEKWPVEG
ncbi:MAG: regulator [Rhodospirillales bacterium]|nr:regulator [Rhodospirillales bacterium]